MRELLNKAIEGMNETAAIKYVEAKLAYVTALEWAITNAGCGVRLIDDGVICKNVWKFTNNHNEESVGGVYGFGKTKLEALAELCRRFEYALEKGYNFVYVLETRNGVFKKCEFHVYYDYYENAFKKVLVRKSKYCNNIWKEMPVEKQDLYWCLSELVRDNFVYPFNRTEENAAKKMEIKEIKLHEHSYIEVIECLISDPYAYGLDDEDVYNYYSNQEAAFFYKVKHYLQSIVTKEEVANGVDVKERIYDNYHKLYYGEG